MTATILAEIEGRRLVTSEDRAEWLAARAGGITATEAKLLYEGGGRARAQLVLDKRSGKTQVEITGNKYIDRGHEREPFIAEWIHDKFDIAPNDYLIHARHNSRHMSTPDGIGVKDGVLVGSEIKTSKNDLTPGKIDKHGYVTLDPDRPQSLPFFRSGYDLQMYWQMHTMGEEVEEMYFVWEQHDNNWPNPQPLDMEPQFCIVRRNQAIIDQMILAADATLAALDGELSGEDLELMAQEFDPIVRQHLFHKRKAAEFEQMIRDRLGDSDGIALETPAWKLSLSQGQARTTFQAAAFKKDHPDLHQQYMKKGEPPKPSMRITARDTNGENE